MMSGVRVTVLCSDLTLINWLLHQAGLPPLTTIDCPRSPLLHCSVRAAWHWVPGIGLHQSPTSDTCTHLTRPPATLFTLLSSLVDIVLEPLVITPPLPETTPCPTLLQWWMRSQAVWYQQHCCTDTLLTVLPDINGNPLCYCHFIWDTIVVLWLPNHSFNKFYN